MTFAGRRVLVVEDDFLVSLMTTDPLERLGCVIVGPAVRIAPALQLAQTEPLDAAVLDIDIAGEMVWPVADELHRRNIPFLFPFSLPPGRRSTGAYLCSANQQSFPRRSIC